MNDQVQIQGKLEAHRLSLNRLLHLFDAVYETVNVDASVRGILRRIHIAVQGLLDRGRRRTEENRRIAIVVDGSMKIQMVDERQTIGHGIVRA